MLNLICESVTHHPPDTRMSSASCPLWAEPCPRSGPRCSGSAGTAGPRSWCSPRTEAPVGPRTPSPASCSPEGGGGGSTTGQQQQPFYLYVSETVDVTVSIFSHMANKKETDRRVIKSFFSSNEKLVFCSLVSRPWIYANYFRVTNQ